MNILQKDDCNNDNDDGDHSEAGDDDDNDDDTDDGDGICPIFPIRLQRLPDHRADGTTGLMIEHPFVKDHDVDDDYIYDIDDVDYDDDCDESMISIIIKVPNMQWQAWWIIRPPAEHNCRSQSDAQHY